MKSALLIQIKAIVQWKRFLAYLAKLHILLIFEKKEKKIYAKNSTVTLYLMKNMTIIEACSKNVKTLPVVKSQNDLVNP